MTSQPTDSTPPDPAIVDHPAMRRRAGGALTSTGIDVLRSAAWTRNWIVLIALLIAIVAIVLAAATQTLVPWVIYPAL